MKRKDKTYTNVKSLGPTFKNNDNIEILILGTIPGENAINNNEYYFENGNRFWITLSEVFNQPFPKTVTEKSDFINKHKIGMWNALKSADRIANSSKDADIDNQSLVFNDFSNLPNTINCIIFNGTCNPKTKPRSLHKKIRAHFDNLGLDINYCYSTSSVQKRFNQTMITENWKKALDMTSKN